MLGCKAAAEPRRAAPRRAEPRRAEPSRAEPSAVSDLIRVIRAGLARHARFYILPVFTLKRLRLFSRGERLRIAFMFQIASAGLALEVKRSTITDR